MGTLRRGIARVRIWGQNQTKRSSTQVNASPKHTNCRWPRSVYAWVLKNLAVPAPIVGGAKAHHLGDAAALDLHLTDDGIRSLEGPYVLRQAT